MPVKLRSLALLALSGGLIACVLLLVSCGGAGSTQTKASVATPAATVPYLPPTVVPNTATATTAPTATATSRPSGPPAPTPTPPHPPAGPSPAGGVPNIGGQLILVSLSQQWLWVYQNRVLIYDTPVTTGMPQLPTPDGIFSVQYHEANVTFISPWPPGSPFYYPPEHVNYAMYFAYNGYFIHDAPWREVFGPGTNYPHTDPNGQHVTGSHGCVELPTSTMRWVYYWAYDGATIDIYGRAPVPPPSPTPTPTPKPSPTPTNPPTPTPTKQPDPTPTSTP